MLSVKTGPRFCHLVKILWRSFSWLQNTADSSSEEGEVSSDEEQRTSHRQSYCSTVSSEGNLSEEENTSEVSMKETTDGLMSTNSSENLQLELAKCKAYEGMSSDGEMRFKRLKQRASPQRSLEVISMW